MKNILIISLLCVLNNTLFAQEKKVPLSPEAAFTQQLGTMEVKVAYARPLVRGRKIFGELVPFDKMWRTGASDCTTIAFNEDLFIGDKKIKAGKYALFSIPNPTEWTIILNTDTTLHGTGGYTEQKDVHRFKVKPMKTERFYETCTIELNDINAKSEGFLNILWENTMVKIPLNTQISEIVAAVIPTPAIQNPAPTPAPMPKMEQKIEPSTAKTDIKIQFAPVLAAYHALKNALVADDSKTAATKAKLLKTALEKIDMTALTPKQHDLYMPLSAKLITDAQHISENATKIDHQREHLETLSTNLSKITKSLKINSETVYVQYCPMKKASWLSTEKAVKNPYYGSSMLTCGSVTDILK
jgi:Protein of unknown function (DUF2911)/Protein of unknown function (DUF3347)